MSEHRSNKIAIAVGMTLAGGLAASGMASADSLFESETLDRGYRVAAADPESRCGEGSCGEEGEEKEGESNCGEGSCGEEGEEREGEGSCGEEGGEEGEEKEGESRCGEGSCGTA